MNLIERIKELDRRYLAADAASRDWLRCRDKRQETNLHRRARRKWARYYQLVNTPIEEQS